MSSKEYELIIHRTFVQNGQLWIHYSLLNQEGQGVHEQFMPLSDLTEGLNYALYQSKFAILKGTSVQVEQTEKVKQSLLDPKESELSTQQSQTSEEPHDVVETSEVETPLPESDPLPDPSHIHDFVLKEPQPQEVDSEKSAAVIPPDPMENATPTSKNSEATEASSESPTIEPSKESDLLPEVTDDEAQAVEMTNEKVNQQNSAAANADTLFGAMAAAEKEE